MGTTGEADEPALPTTEIETRGLSLWRLIQLDYRRYAATGDGGWFTILFLTRGFWAGLVYRISRRLWQVTPRGFLRRLVRLFLSIVQHWTEAVAGITIPLECEIGPGLYIGHFGGIFLPAHGSIGENCNISQGVTLGLGGSGDKRGAPKIGNRVYIGTHATVVGNITIGDDAVICAGAIVTKSVPPRGVAMGNPARVVSHEGSFAYVRYDGMDVDPARMAALAAASDGAAPAAPTATSVPEPASRMSGSGRMVLAAGALSLAALLLVPVDGVVHASGNRKTKHMDLTAYSAKAPESRLRMLFIHHSCGGTLLADRGPERQGAGNCIYISHPDGGGLRGKLDDAGYEVHEASYGSAVGQNTNLFDWAPKFRTDMDRVLQVDVNDTLYSDDRKNQVVVFKSCYTESTLAGEGTAPGNPAGPERTLWNYKAATMALLEEFKKHPKTLFVYVTAPPKSPVLPKEALWKTLVKEVSGKGMTPKRYARQAQLVRSFNNWLTAPDGWLRDYPLRNVVVFDYYDVLTDHGASNLSCYTRGEDSHPTATGQAKAAAEFVPFLNRAVRRAGLAADDQTLLAAAGQR